MRLPLALALAACGCASTGSAAAPVPDAVLAEAARLFDGPGCPAPDDAACCATSERQLREARGRGDDRTADQEAERLALYCPAHRKGLLKPEAARKKGERASATVGLVYDLRLAPQDRIVWAAAYVRGAHVSEELAPGPADLDVDLRIAAGEGADAGTVYRVQQRIPVVLAAGDIMYPTVRVTRTPASPPFRLEIDDAKPHPPAGNAIGAVGLVGPRADGTRPPSPLAFRGPVPPFEPPAELMTAGAPAQALSAELADDGRVARITAGPALVHPRLLGAALDWIRKVPYAAPVPDHGLVWNGDTRTLRFERIEIPASEPEAGAQLAPRTTRR